jgi:hypothetical protein
MRRSEIKRRKIINAIFPFNIKKTSWAEGGGGESKVKYYNL